MAQRYSDRASLARMEQGRCPECGYVPDHHGGWGHSTCSLRPDGVLDRIDQYRRDLAERAS